MEKQLGKRRRYSSEQDESDSQPRRHDSSDEDDDSEQPRRRHDSSEDDHSDSQQPQYPMRPPESDQESQEAMLLERARLELIQEN
jgi:hypothetical protein